MGKSWTKEERKKHLRSRTHSNKEKTIVLGTVIIIIILFLGAIYYSVAYRLEFWIPIVLLVMLIIVILGSTFFIDFIFYESQ